MVGGGSVNPYVFVVGCQRSGTTLTERLLDAHSRLAMTHETRWIPELFEQRRGVSEAGLVEPGLVAALLEHKRFGQLGISAEQLQRLVLGDPPPPYSALVSGLFDLYGRARGKALVGDKTPRYARCVELLHELWPRARFVHVIRDGRDVYLSRRALDRRRGVSRPSPWPEQPALTAGLWWTAKVRAARHAGAALGPRLYYELRYEALVADPAAQCAALCAFLDLPYEPAMLRFYERSHNARAPAARHPHSPKRLPVTAGLRDWRAELSARELRHFEATGGELLDELGYERTAPAPDPHTLKQAARVRAAFADSMRRRGHTLPPDWEHARPEHQ